MAIQVKTGPEITWKWVLTLVALTFLFIYLLNNVRPGFVEPYKVIGFQVPLPETPPEEEYYPDEYL